MTEENIKSSKEKQQTCLLDLNENIFHEIFQYLPYDDLYLYVRAASKKKGAICFSHLYSRCENILFEILQGKLDLGRFPHHISIKEASSADLV